MGGGLAYQKWFDRQGQKNYIDFSDAQLYVGPCFLYIFYGMLDAFWQVSPSTSRHLLPLFESC
jgi:hypothetical protein